MAVKPSQGPIPVQEQGKPQTAILEHYRREMDERLEEIEGWLALEQNKRAPCTIGWLISIRQITSTRR